MSKISSELEVLVNRKLDGTISREELDALHRILSESEDVRRYLRDMEELDASLRNFVRAPAVPDMSPSVMERIRQDRERVFGSDSKSLPLMIRFQGRALLRYAAMLAIGILLGSVVTLMVQPGRLLTDSREMAGTMAARSGQKMAFAQDDWQVQVNPMVVDNMVILVLTAAADDPIEVTLSFDTEAYRLLRARYLSGREMHETVRADRISFGVQGKTHYQIVLNKNTGFTGPFVLEVLQEGRLSYNRQFFVQ
ncbi:MAG: hypothetical protein RG741_01550 [Bacteroidales bacterium]|nr:hypothetical protein [Bacteroidales bacterium]